MTYPEDDVHCKDCQGVEDCPHSLSHDKLWREGREWAKYLLTAPSDQNQQERYCVQGQGAHNHHCQLLPSVEQRTLVYEVHCVCMELESNRRGNRQAWCACVWTVWIVSMCRYECSMLVFVMLDVLQLQGNWLQQFTHTHYTILYVLYRNSIKIIINSMPLLLVMCIERKFHWLDNL